VVGEEAIVRYLLHLLHMQPQHRTALRNSGPVTPQRSSSSSSSSRGGGSSSGGSSRRQQEDGKLAAMRSALWAAATHGLDGGGGAAAAAAGQHAAAAGWHPGSDDANAVGSAWAAAAAAADDNGGGSSDDEWAPADERDADETEAWRLEVLLRRLGVAGALNPTQQQGALIRLLQAWRQGQLGKYCLDELPPLPPS
jgi:hypothetical protein